MVGPNSERINVLENEIFGAVTFNYGFTRRTEIIGNRIHGGAASDVVALGGQGFDCLVDANYFVDTPGRMNFCPRRHCYIRYNEMHQAFRGTWATAEEVFLVHGGMSSDVGTASGATDITLTDGRRNWLPDKHTDHAVIITAGRGFGQYRFVTGNTKDTLRLDKPWRVRPDKTSRYSVGAMFSENAWFANLNNTPCRMSLWLNCLSNVVEYHRDVFSGGIDLWGRDRSQVLEDGTVKNMDTFRPSWYNAIDNCWMDGASAHLWSVAQAHNLYKAPVHFANRVTRNRIRQPHMRRTGYTHGRPARDAGIVVGNRSGQDMTKPQDARIALSHTIVAGNFLSFTHNGISVSDYARKTFLTNNVFQEVDRPVLDWGARTIGYANKVVAVTETGENTTKLKDIKNEREMAETSGRLQAALPIRPTGLQLRPSVRELRQLVSQLAYAFYHGVHEERVEQQCRENLRQLWRRIKKYEATHGHLPKAGFYPQRPRSDEDSLIVLLGKEAGSYFICPTIREDLRRLPLHYVWNQQVSGKRLTDIQDPANTWLMADLVVVHDWLVKNHFCGHRGKVNVLYADGTVRSVQPFDRKFWDTWLGK